MCFILSHLCVHQKTKICCYKYFKQFIITVKANTVCVCLGAKFVQHPIESLPVSPPFPLACVFHVYSFPFPVLGQQVPCFSYLPSSPLPLRLECADTSQDRVDSSVPLLFWAYHTPADLWPHLCPLSRSFKPKWTSTTHCDEELRGENTRTCKCEWNASLTRQSDLINTPSFSQVT